MHRTAAALLCLAFLIAGDPARAQTAVAVREPIAADRLMADVQALSAPGMEGRGTGTAGGAKARAFIRERFQAVGLEDLGGGFEAPFVPTRRPGTPPADSQSASGPQAANVVGLCRGTDRDLPFIVVSAHYDHLGIRSGVVYPGADDNASGVAALLQLAEACVERPFRHSLIFVAFDAEEMGLQGARAFVASPPVPKDRLALNVNLDMVARGDRSELYLAGLSRHPQLKALVQPVSPRPPVAVLFGHDSGGGSDDWTSQSDHGAFHSAGIPFLYFGVEDHADYHQPTDTAEKIDPRFFAAAVGTVLDTLRALDAGL